MPIPHLNQLKLNSVHFRTIPYFRRAFLCCPWILEAYYTGIKYLLTTGIMYP